MKRNRWHAHLAITLALATAVGAYAYAETRKVTPAPAGPGEWQVIGTVQADHTADHDAIIVKGPFDDFSKIKFIVTDAPVNIHRLVVTYDNGDPDRIPVRDSIKEGGESRVIDLEGRRARSIRKIEFWYDTKGSGKGKADVTVYGMK